MKKRYIILSVGVAVAFSGFCCLSKLNSGKEMNASPQAARPVPTMVARPFNKTETRIFPGKVRANRRVKLAFTVSGLITELNALEGQSVEKGEVLARLDARDFQHALNIAKARYAETRQAFKRVSGLREKNIVSVSEYEKVKAEYDIAEVELRMRIKALKDTVLIAPFDGVVADRFVENHEHVNAKEPVLSFQDISVTEVVIQAPERIIMCGGAENLKKIQVSFGAGKKHIFDASLRESCICSDSVTGTFDAAIVLKERPEMRILPGMTATVLVETSAFHDAANVPSRIMLPAEAVFSEPDGNSYVWIIKPDGGKPHKRRIKIGSMRNEGVEIISGLNAGEHVAVSGIHSLREDLEARPMKKGKDGLDG
jgi:RND family efflux transporter MFP subunit